MQQLTRERLPRFQFGYKKKNQKKKSDKRKIQKSRKRKKSKKNQEKENSKKIRKRKIQKNRKKKRKKSKKIRKKRKLKKNKKEKNAKKQKRKIQKKQKRNNPKKIEKGKIQKKKVCFSVVLDKMCVFCLYPIPDSQQYIKRDSCRRPILSGLLCVFSFGPRTLSFSFCLFIYFIRVFLSRLVLVILFRVYFVFNCYWSLNVMSCCFLSCLAFVLTYVKCLFI